MNKQTSIQIKAAFLLVVFALNTLVGFACSMGMDMGFNSNHHPEEAIIPVVHIHPDGKEHIHYEKKPGNHDIVTKHNKQEKAGKHDHDKKTDHDENGDITKDKKDNCCKDQVLKFEQTDKAVAKAFAYQTPLFALSFFNHLYKDDLYTSEIAPKIKYFVRSYHPPIPDIRIAIQSFQI